ncbi:hypothetical protein [Sphingomonas sp. Leaf30]|uniref:hypothetical protein n=1 Tax=Sphingomonas sp. Leaf30 TaxID=1736213 RepID=UPI001F164439|nr:hypothetical protein [Sphingomonas sp. Leaf30]
MQIVLATDFKQTAMMDMLYRHTAIGGASNYPADIDTIKADIEIELEQCAARANHEVCMSGYPVMTADFDENYVKLAETAEDVKQENLIAHIEADEFVAALRSAMEQAVHLNEA